jgi:uncharacterized protein with ATP-grasp and redox domains
LKTELGCYACLVNQALRISVLAGCKADQQRSVINHTLQLLQESGSVISPPEIVQRVQRFIRQEVAVVDPLEALKSSSTRAALALYPRLKDLIANSDDPIGTALRVSIAGNIIDFAVSDEPADLWGTVQRVLTQAYAIDDEAALRVGLKSADHLLMLADNAGETVFDRLLIEVLEMPVIYAVKGAPTLNDATREDALAAGLGPLARIVDNGTDAPGTLLAGCSSEFLSIFDAAPLIIAKGQANFETLDDVGPRLFRLLQVKCSVIGSHIGAPIGSIVIRKG